MRPYQEGEKKENAGRRGWLAGLGTLGRAAERGETDRIILAAASFSSRIYSQGEDEDESAAWAYAREE